MPRGDLSDYDAKREFEITPELGGGRKPANYGPLGFVVQKHDASRLHYDLRLELDGTYKSWAVPRGPSFDPKKKRLAVMVEDHPLEYGTFEGVIPKGEYGAGEDIVWDNGTYGPDEGDPAVFDRGAAQERLRRDLASGKLSIRLRGRKLKGSWALVKTTQDERSWLFFKHDDGLTSTEADVLADEASVLSGVTIDDLKAGVELPPATGLLLPNPAEAPKAKAAKPPRSLKPMMAEREDAAVLDRARFRAGDWLVEPKLDGIRAVVTIRDGASTLVSRNGNDLTAAYPAVVAALSSHAADVLVLDEELVAPISTGVPSFERLQQRMGLIDEGQIAQADAEIPVIYYAFDVLHVDGVDLRQTPLRTRKQILRRLVDPSAFVQVLDAIDAPPRRVFDSLVAQGFEGVVAKRADGPYRSGKRSADWIKVKVQHSDEFVVGGFRRGNGARKSTFGALLVGQFREDGSFDYMGRVGSGLSDDLLVAMRARLGSADSGGKPVRRGTPRREADDVCAA